MKTETKIAKENVEKYKKDIRGWDIIYKEHLESCQRFLEFLEEKQIELDKLENELTNGFGQKEFDVDLNLKITDLQNAIKLYEKENLKLKKK